MVPKLLAALVMAASALRSAAAQPAAAPHVGCYRASRVLGTAADPHPEWGEAGLETFRLLEGGRVERRDVGSPAGYTPGLAASARASWARFSRWSVAGDTLAVTLSTGTSGWALRLLPAASRGTGVSEGEARYLTDVVVRDTVAWRPPRVVVRVMRVLCASPA